MTPKARAPGERTKLKALPFSNSDSASVTADYQDKRSPKISQSMLQEKGDLEALGQTPVMIDTQCQTSLECILLKQASLIKPWL